MPGEENNKIGGSNPAYMFGVNVISSDVAKTQWERSHIITAAFCCLLIQTVFVSHEVFVILPKEEKVEEPLAVVKRAKKVRPSSVSMDSGGLIELSSNS